MKIKKIIFSISILILLIGIVSAASISIDMQSSFGIGEEVSFNYTLLSNINENIQYVVSVNCPNAPLPLLEIKETSLLANIPLTENYIYLSEVKDDLIAQTCTAIIEVIGSVEVSINKSFEILTNPFFDFNVNLCKEASCFERSFIFIKGEDIYFNYVSDVHDLTISANLTYPNDQTEKLNIPSLIKAEQIGTYGLEITASKENYKTISKNIQFGVIKEEAKIEYTSLEELKEENEQKEVFGKVIPYLIVGGLILALIIGIIYLLKKRKKITSFVTIF